MAILVPDSIENWNGVPVKKYLFTEHNTKNIAMPVKRTKTLKGVTIHNTEAISVSSSTTPAEQYCRATIVNNMMLDVRVHFYIDDYCAWQCLPLDWNNWSCADGKGDGNTATIAIEVIGNSAKAEANAAKLAAYLLNKYNLNVEDNLFTHTHWLNVKDGIKGDNDYLNTHPNPYKWCPLYILPHWDTFKANVKESLDKLKGKNSSIPVPELYRIRKTWEDASSQIGAYGDLNNAKAACKEGYNVYDKEGKLVYSKEKTEVPKPVEQKPTTPAAAPVEEKINVTYRVHGNSKWFGEITNYNEKDDMGYAGVERVPVTAIVAKASKGTLKYRVHVKNGGWLSWISDYNPNNWATGCAGTRTRQIDAIQFDLQNLPNYQVRYRVSTINSNSYLNWISGYNNSDDMGYSGIFGQVIDKLQVEIYKK